MSKLRQTINRLVREEATTLSSIPAFQHYYGPTATMPADLERADDDEEDDKIKKVIRRVEKKSLDVKHGV